jgi:7-cyano-7-deazaguanine synthase in queuosine biosynthesis
MEQHEEPLAHAKGLVAGLPQTRPLAQRVRVTANTADRILYRELNFDHACGTGDCIHTAHRDYLSSKDHSRETRHCMECIGCALRRRAVGKSGLRRFLSYPTDSRKGQNECAR